MSHTRRRRSRAALATFGAVFLAAGLSACVNGEFVSNPAIDLGLEVVGLGKKDEPVAVPPPTSGAPLIVGYETTRVALPNTGPRGQSQYYVAPDGVEIAMNGSFVTRAIGLGFDLQGMYLPKDSPYTSGFVQAARENVVTDRVADYYRNGHILNDSFRCALTYVPRENGKGIVNEQCRRLFGGLGFRNTYWTEGDRVVCSLQWFHPDSTGQLQFFETAEQAQAIDLRQQGC